MLYLWSPYTRRPTLYVQDMMRMMRVSLIRDISHYAHANDKFQTQRYFEKIRYTKGSKHFGEDKADNL
jgi:hypothetical protein